MAFEPNAEPLKPDAKFIKGSLDLLGKYENDLDYLRNGKMIIERNMAEKGIDDAVVDKKLSKLSKSIEKLEQMVDDYRNQIEKAQAELDDLEDESNQESDNPDEASD